MAAPMLAFGVRFRPGAAPTLLRVPAVALVDDTVPLRAVDVRLAQRLDAALLHAGDEQEAFDALNRELVGWLERLQPDPMQHATGGRRSVRGYADQSHLSRETRRLTGLTPRQLVRWIG